ncbi:MAG: hypothetical protein ACYTGX_00385 [Planctomycetota bacterium]|jgi:hypothetical protein
MAEIDPFEAYKRAQEAKKKQAEAPKRKPAPPPAPKPKVQPSAAPVPRPKVPALKPKAAPAKPAPAAKAPAPAPKPAPAPAAADDPAAAPKARGLVRHKFAKDDLMKMGDDRNFEPAKPSGLQDTHFDPETEAQMEAREEAGDVEVAPPSRLVKGGFHEDDAAAMKAADDPSDDDEQLARPRLVRHMFHKGDLQKMGDDRNFDPPPPSNIEKTQIGEGIGDNASDETDEEAEERRRRRYGAGLMGSQREAQGNPLDDDFGERGDDDGGGEDAPAE